MLLAEVVHNDETSSKLPSLISWHAGLRQITWSKTRTHFVISIRTTTIFSVQTCTITNTTYIRNNKPIMLNRLATRAPRAARALSSSLARPALATSLHATPTSASSHTPHPTISSTSSQTRSYHEKVLDHYSSPRNVGSMSKTAPDVGTGLVGAPACGDVMKLQIKVDPATDTITDVKFKTFGCGSAIASSSYMTELVRGMTLEKAGAVKNTEIARELCLPPVKCEFRVL